MAGGGAAGKDEVDGEAGDRGVGVDDVEAGVGEGGRASVMVALMAAGGGFQAGGDEAVLMEGGVEGAVVGGD